MFPFYIKIPFNVNTLKDNYKINITLNIKT